MVQTTFLGLGDLAKLLGVAGWRIGRLFDEHKIPEPPRIAGRRVFGPREIQQVANFLRVEVPVDKTAALPTAAES